MEGEGKGEVRVRDCYYKKKNKENITAVQQSSYGCTQEFAKHSTSWSCSRLLLEIFLRQRICMVIKTKLLINFKSQ